MKLGRKIITALSIVSILIQSLSPLAYTVPAAFAQEATPASNAADATPTQEPSPTPTDTVTPTPTPTPSLDESLTMPQASESAIIDTSSTENQSSVILAPPVWQTNLDGSATTINPVTLNQTYKAPQNDKVTVKFNKLPESPGRLTIKEVTLTDEQANETKALSNLAYDISSDMENSTFEYALTLPTTKTENVEVKASEDGQTFVTLGGVTAQTDTLTITGLNHFTLFLISADTTGDSYTTTTGPSIVETANQQLTTGTIILTRPSGFEFNTGVTVSATISSTTTNSSCFTFSSTTATSGAGTLTASVITFTVSAQDANGGSPEAICQVVFSNIQTRPTSGSPLASGDITLSGTATLGGATFNPNTFTEVAGAVSASVSTVGASPTSVLANGTATSTVTVTLKDANSNPVSGKTVTLSSSRGATDTISAASGSSDASGIVTFTVKSSTIGTSTFTATDTTDGVTITQTASVDFTNVPPSFDAISNQNVNEDATAQNASITNVSPGPDGEAGQTVTLSATSNNTSVVPNPTVSGSGATRTLAYTPVANANGSATITVTANDGQTQNNTFSRTFIITVNAVNDTPSFTKGTDQAIFEDAGAQTVSSWATSISIGPANESGQTANFIVTNGNNSLFSVQPAVAANGTLTYTPAANANGSATVTISLHDDGGTVNGGNDTSATQTFMITVNPVNDSPTITVTSPNGGEVWAGGSSHAITWSASDVDNASNTLTVDLAYTINGTGFTSIASGLTNSGTYTWNPVASLDSSTVKIRAIATDPSSATGTDLSNANFTIDSTAPTGSIFINDGATYTNSTSVSLDFSGVSSDVTTMELRNSTTGSFQNPIVYENPHAYILPTGDGIKTVSVRFTDNAGNKSTTIVETTSDDIILDTVAPDAPTSVSLTDPINLSNITEMNVILTGNGEVNATVNYTITDGTNNVTGTGIADGGLINLGGIDVSSLSDGMLTVSVTLTDATGNISSAGTDTATKDTVAPPTPEAPTVAGDNIINNEELNNLGIDVVGTAEPSSQLTVTLTDDTGDANSVSDTTQADESGNYFINLDGTGAEPDVLQDGTITVTVIATDASGNESYQQTVQITQDTTLPSITIDPYNTNPTNADVTVNASTDEGSTLNSTSNTFSENGDFDFVATDGAGNVTTETVSITNIDKTSPTVTKLGDDSTDVVLNAGDTNLTFSEALSDSSKTAVENALTAGADKELSYYWNDSYILTITSSEATTFVNDVVVNVSDLAGNTANGLLIVDSKLADTQTTPDSEGDATANSETPQVVITDPDQEVTVTVEGTTDATIDVSSFITDGTGDIPQITINSDNADVAIPATTVTGPEDWDGVIAAPTVTTVTLPETSGETKTLSTAIEIGFADAKLSFDKAVRILLPGQAGKKAGYSRPGTAFTEITSTCTADNQATGDGLAVDGDCKIDSGLDLVIWTKHFTKFATYTQTTSSSNSSSSSSSGDSSTSAPTCNDTKPGSAPVLIRAVAGPNSVILTWSEASDPVSYYLVAYGTSSGSLQFGNPNVGGKGTTTYTVGGLSGGTTYYFKVRAGNGCMPGDYSNELSAAPLGGFVAGPAAGFSPGVLGVTSESATSEEKKEEKKTPEVLGKEVKKEKEVQPQNLFAPTTEKTVSIIVVLILAALFGLWISQRLRKT